METRAEAWATVAGLLRAHGYAAWVDAAYRPVIPGTHPQPGTVLALVTCAPEMVIGVCLGNTAEEPEAHIPTRSLRVAHANAHNDDGWPLGRDVIRFARFYRVTQPALGGLVGLLPLRMGRRTVWVDAARVPDMARRVGLATFPRDALVSFGIFCAAADTLERETASFGHVRLLLHNVCHARPVACQRPCIHFRACGPRRGSSPQKPQFVKHPPPSRRVDGHEAHRRARQNPPCD